MAASEERAVDERNPEEAQKKKKRSSLLAIVGDIDSDEVKQMLSQKSKHAGDYEEVCCTHT